MPQPDDQGITGLLYRRIPNTGGKTKWDAGGNPTFGPSNFIDRTEELSLQIAAETPPEMALEGPEHEGYGLAQVTAEAVRLICKERNVDLSIRRNEPPPGHIEICGKITDGMAKAIQKASQWVPGYLPQRPNPNTSEIRID